MKTLKHITEGMFASDVREGLFDVEDNARIADFNSEWEELWNSVQWKNATIKSYKAELNDGVLKIKKIEGKSHEPFLICDEFEEFVVQKDIKTIDFVSENHVYLNSIGNYVWITPVTVKCEDLVICFGLQMRNVTFESKYIEHFQFEGIDLCSIISDAFYQQNIRNGKKLNYKKINSKHFQVEWMDFAYELDQLLGPASTDDVWCRYLFDVTMPYRKGVFKNVVFQKNSPKNVYDIVLSTLIKNPKDAHIDEIYINFYENNKWFTLRVRKNATDICKGEYGVGCKDGKLIFALSSRT